jgi:hypothetical protein
VPPEVVGEPLAKIIRELRESSGGTAYGFFSSPSPELGRLTPVEVLTGKLTTTREIDAATAALLSVSRQARLDAVLGAAGAYVADLGP